MCLWPSGPMLASECLSESSQENDRFTANQHCSILVQQGPLPFLLFQPESYYSWPFFEQVHKPCLNESIGAYEVPGLLPSFKVECAVWRQEWWWDSVHLNIDVLGVWRGELLGEGGQEKVQRRQTKASDISAKLHSRVKHHKSQGWHAPSLSCGCSWMGLAKSRFGEPLSPLLPLNISSATSGSDHSSVRPFFVRFLHSLSSPLAFSPGAHSWLVALACMRCTSRSSCHSLTSCWWKQHAHLAVAGCWRCLRGPLRARISQIVSGCRQEGDLGDKQDLLSVSCLLLITSMTWAHQWVPSRRGMSATTTPPSGRVAWHTDKSSYCGRSVLACASVEQKQGQALLGAGLWTDQFAVKQCATSSSMHRGPHLSLSLSLSISLRQLGAGPWETARKKPKGGFT